MLLSASCVSIGIRGGVGGGHWWVSEVKSRRQTERRHVST
jgi:hypothetical protein